MQVKDLIGRLKQLRALRMEVKRLSQRIEALETEARGGTRRFNGALRMHVDEECMAHCAVELAELQQRMSMRQVACMKELNWLYAFIDDAPDSMMRQILAARYIDGMSWQRVATSLRESDEQYPRRLHNRYLQQKVDEWNEVDGTYVCQTVSERQHDDGRRAFNGSDCFA